MVALQIKLRTIFLMCVYTGVCSLIYVYSNLWFGTLVVVATITWLGLATNHAFRHQSQFWLGFVISGWAWLVLCFGFYGESKTNFDITNVQKAIYWIASPFRPTPEYDPNLRYETFGYMTSLHVSGPMASQPGTLLIPAWHNALRLVVCLSSLLLGTVGGIIMSVIARRRVVSARCASQETVTG